MNRDLQLLAGDLERVGLASPNHLIIQSFVKGFACGLGICEREGAEDGDGNLWLLQDGSSLPSGRNKCYLRYCCIYYDNPIGLFQRTLLLNCVYNVRENCHY